MIGPDSQIGPKFGSDDKKKFGHDQEGLDNEPVLVFSHVDNEGCALLGHGRKYAGVKKRRMCEENESANFELEEGELMQRSPKYDHATPALEKAGYGECYPAAFGEYAESEF